MTLLFVYFSGGRSKLSKYKPKKKKKPTAKVKMGKRGAEAAAIERGKRARGTT